MCQINFIETINCRTCVRHSIEFEACLSSHFGLFRWLRWGAKQVYLDICIECLSPIGLPTRFHFEPQSCGNSLNNNRLMALLVLHVIAADQQIWCVLLRHEWAMCSAIRLGSGWWHPVFESRISNTSIVWAPNCNHWTSRIGIFAASHGAMK